MRIFGHALALGAIIAGFAAAIVGWLSNIFALFYIAAFSGEAVLRVIGVFVFPIGAIMGYV